MMWTFDQMSWFWPVCKALDMARERFTRGEITPGEFEILKRGLAL